MSLSDVLAKDVATYLTDAFSFSVTSEELTRAIVHVLNKRLNDLVDVVDLSGLPEGWSVHTLDQSAGHQVMFKYSCRIANYKLGQFRVAHSTHAQAAFDLCVSRI